LLAFGKIFGAGFVRLSIRDDEIRCGKENKRMNSLKISRMSMTRVDDVKDLFFPQRSETKKASDRGRNKQKKAHRTNDKKMEDCERTIATRSSLIDLHSKDQLITFDDSFDRNVSKRERKTKKKTHKFRSLFLTSDVVSVNFDIEWFIPISMLTIYDVLGINQRDY
jgi:hypothetical protein